MLFSVSYTCIYTYVTCACRKNTYQVFLSLKMLRQNIQNFLLLVDTYNLAVLKIFGCNEHFKAYL